MAGNNEIWEIFATRDGEFEFDEAHSSEEEAVQSAQDLIDEDSGLEIVIRYTDKGHNPPIVNYLTREGEYTTDPHDWY